MKKTNVDRSVTRKLLLFLALCLCSVCVAVFERPVEASGEAACVINYETCSSNCPRDSNGNLIGGGCITDCFNTVSSCITQAEDDHEDEMMDEGQPLPNLEGFRTCLQQCGFCNVFQWPGDPDGFALCQVTWLACKVNCLNSY